MKTVTLTLDLSYTDAARILALLQSTDNAAIIKIDDGETVKVSRKPVTIGTVIPTAGKKTIMPGFGRSQEEINEFTENEQKRFDTRSEEDLLKEQRNEERKVRQAEKQEKINEKKAEERRTDNEVASIKAMNLTSEQSSIMVKAPWGPHDN